MRPAVIVGRACVADHYADKTRERIIEVSDRETGLGCLVSIRRADSGELDIAVYRRDPGVRVTIAKEDPR